MELLKQARRRVIIAGGGVIAAGAGACAASSWRERLGAPIVDHRERPRCDSEERHPLAVGNLYQSRAMAAAIANRPT